MTGQLSPVTDATGARSGGKGLIDNMLSKYEEDNKSVNILLEEKSSLL